MKAVIGGFVAPLVVFAVLVAGAPDASATSVGESHLPTTGKVSLVSGSFAMAPQPPQLSDEEKRAVENKKAGRPYDKEAFKRATKKLVQSEKYNKERNRQKRRK